MQPLRSRNIFLQAAAKHHNFPALLLSEVNDRFQPGHMGSETRQNHGIVKVLSPEHHILQHFPGNLLTGRFHRLPTVQAVKNDGKHTVLSNLLQPVRVSFLPQHRMVVKLKIICVDNCAFWRMHSNNGRLQC